MLHRPPLPFRGNKGIHYKATLNILNKYINNKDIKRVVDVFGGSGYCSYLARQAFVNEGVEVIYNDYDYFINRINMADTTCKIRNEMYNIVKDKCQYYERIPENEVNKIKEVLNAYNDKDVDFITIGSYLLHSSRYCQDRETLYANGWYNRIRETQIDKEVCDNYLKGITVIHEDWHDVLNTDKYDMNSTLFILDPPYNYTDKSGYKNNGYFSLSNSLDILFKMIKLPYCIYYTSQASEMIEALNLLSDVLHIELPRYEIYEHKRPIGMNELIISWGF